MEIPCPNCKQILNVPENLIGKKIRCSACQAVVEAKQPNPATSTPQPQEEPPLAPKANKKSPAASDNPFALDDDASPASDFEFDAPTDKINVGIKLKMKAAADTMMYGLGYAAFVSLVLLAPPIFVTIYLLSRPNRPPLAEVSLGLSMVWFPICCAYSFVFVFGFVIYLGARSLRHVRSRGKVIAGAVCSILLGVEGLFGIIRCAINFMTNEEINGCLLGVIGFLSFIQVLFCLWGGIRALILISRQDIREAIQAEEARSQKAEIVKGA